MKRTRIIGLCLVAVFAMSALATGTASAAAPEFGQCLKKAVVGGAGYSEAKCLKAVGTAGKYEWVPGWGGHNKFTSTGTTATLKTSGGKTVTCKKENSTGNIHRRDRQQTRGNDGQLHDMQIERLHLHDRRR